MSSTPGDNGGASTEAPPFFSKGKLGNLEDAARCGWSQEEFDFWQPHSCGTCCLKTIGDSRGVSLNLTLADITELCVRKGVFAIEGNTVSGAFHFPMVNLLADWGISAEVRRQLPLNDIISALTQGCLVILSVDLKKLNPPHDSTHLVIVFGYDEVDKEFSIHDSASILKPIGSGLTLDTEELARLSNGRGIVVAPGPTTKLG